jgi:ferredoxin
MIVAERKPLEEIAEQIKDANTVLIIGCGGCVTVCLSGGQKEVDILAAALRMKRQQEGKPLQTITETLERQCDPEYVGKVEKAMADVDCVVSMGCGVGVQFLAERYPNKWIVPALNTKFAGATLEHGHWEERCGLCGDCVLHMTGGICPVIRCSKSLLNGPCGGSQNGVCEISKEVKCGWQLIYDRLKGLGKLDLIYQVHPAKNWSKNRDGGPRKMVREDLAL